MLNTPESEARGHGLLLGQVHPVLWAWKKYQVCHTSNWNMKLLIMSLNFTGTFLEITWWKCKLSLIFKSDEAHYSILAAVDYPSVPVIVCIVYIFYVNITLAILGYVKTTTAAKLSFYFYLDSYSCLGHPVHCPVIGTFPYLYSFYFCMESVIQGCVFLCLYHKKRT